MKNDILLRDEEFLPAATNLISSAQQSIYISTFKAEMTTKPRGRHLIKFFDLIVEKSRLGLDVRFVLNKFTGSKSIPFTNLYAIQELKRQKINVRCFVNDRICHAKIIIVDGTAAILGSHNLSVKSCHNNFEVSIFFQDTQTVQLLASIFMVMFEVAKKV